MKKKYDYIFFDVANTLLHKPDLFDRILEAFAENGNQINLKHLIHNHKLLSEVIKFPDKTSREFYNNFNKELCLSLGVLPSEKRLNDIFERCSYLPWKPFSDVAVINELTSTPIGIISNWDDKLKTVLGDKVQVEFDPIIGSNYEGVSKPDLRIFENAWNEIGKENKNILFIGDSIKLDMMPAISIGWDVRLIDRDKIFDNFPYRIDRLTDLKNVVEC